MVVVDATLQRLWHDRRPFDRLVDDRWWGWLRRLLNRDDRLGTLLVAMSFESRIVLASKGEDGEQDERFHPWGRRHRRGFRSEEIWLLSAISKCCDPIGTMAKVYRLAA